MPLSTTMRLDIDRAAATFLRAHWGADWYPMLTTKAARMMIVPPPTPGDEREFLVTDETWLFLGQAKFETPQPDAFQDHQDMPLTDNAVITVRVGPLDSWRKTD